MIDTFSINVEYGIKYTTKNPVPIPEIIETLESYERILKRTGPFIEKAFAGIKIIDTKVHISYIESGSLIEHFLVEYVFKGQENYDEAKKVFDKLMKDNDVVRTIVAMGVGGLIVYGVTQALPSGKPATNIEAHNNTILNFGADIDFSSSDFQAALKAATKDRKALAKDAVAAVRPAKSDPSAEIQIDGMPGLNLTSAAILEVPDEYAPPVPSERTSNYAGVTLLIHASDRDNKDKGWAGTVAGIVSSRKPVVLGDGIDPEALHGRTSFKANITVHERYSKRDKRYLPQSIEVSRVN
jgi:hypothetical protein